jgi:hypothetical protein
MTSATMPPSSSPTTVTPSAASAPSLSSSSLTPSGVGKLSYPFLLPTFILTLVNVSVLLCRVGPTHTASSRELFHGGRRLRLFAL